EDGDPATSDGIAVFLGRERPSFVIGDQVRVTGTVTEFYGFTEIDDRGLQIAREWRDAPVPEAVAINPPGGAAELTAYFEPLESMRVAVAGAAAVTGPTFSGCGFAVRADGGVGRIFRRELADPIGAVLPILHTNDVNCDGFPQVKSGDAVSGLAGPLIYNFDQFKLVQQDGAALMVTAVPIPPLPAPPQPAPDQFAIATFNMENYFDGVDDTGTAEEPKLSAADLAVKQDKLAYALAHTLGCPAVVAVQEVEHAALLAELADLAADACGFTYEVVHRESADVRGIDVAYLVNPVRVQVGDVGLWQGCTAVATGVSDPTANCAAGQSPLFSRPPLEMAVLLDGQPYTFLVVHLKSKREGEGETAVWRMAQAGFINEWAAAKLAADAAARLVVLGDFNDYELSPPLLAMTAEHLHNVLLQIPDEARYSYVYGGVSQMIDAVLVSAALLPQVAGVQILHVNADYPDAWGNDTSAAYLPYKSTDHDLPLLLLQLPASTATPTPAPLPTQIVVPMGTAVAPIVDDGDGGKGGWGTAVFGAAVGGIVVILVLARLFRRKT
ncbi:MAG: endonuclease/exonuclease/phosphatase family protein, partial [Anaerolineales bacterium]|nr:endonuclease/exonuclease/phosphatase family protein [Anaerolineales bacterium]